MSLRGRLPVILLLASVATSACGGGDTPDADSGEGSASTPSPPGTDPDDAEGSAEGADDTEAAAANGATVVVDGTTYTFSVANAITGSCEETFGALLVTMPLTEVDGAPSTEGPGQLGMTLAGDPAQDAVTVNFPDGLYLAGYNEISLDTPAVALSRDGLTAEGTQALVSPNGEERTAEIRVSC